MMYDNIECYICYVLLDPVWDNLYEHQDQFACEGCFDKLKDDFL